MALNTERRAPEAAYYLSQGTQYPYNYRTGLSTPAPRTEAHTILSWNHQSLIPTIFSQPIWQ